MMIPPMIAATARTAMIQLEPPSRPFFFETAEVERAPSNAVAAATGAAIIEVAARETAALVSRFIIFSIHWYFRYFRIARIMLPRPSSELTSLGTGAGNCNAFCPLTAIPIDLLNRQKAPHWHRFTRGEHARPARM